MRSESRPASRAQVSGRQAITFSIIRLIALIVGTTPDREDGHQLGSDAEAEVGRLTGARC